MRFFDAIERGLARLMSPSRSPKARGAAPARPVAPADLDHELRDQALRQSVRVFSATWIPDRVRLLVPEREAAHWENLREAVLTQSRRTLRDLVRDGRGRFRKEPTIEMSSSGAIPVGGFRIELTFSDPEAAPPPPVVAGPVATLVSRHLGALREVVVHSGDALGAGAEGIAVATPSDAIAVLAVRDATLVVRRVRAGAPLFVSGRPVQDEAPVSDGDTLSIGDASAHVRRGGV